MRLSTKAQYAVQAMVSLSLYAGGQPMSLKDISLRENLSLTYLEQLFVKLRRGGLVESARGPGGGYLLARSPSSIRIDEIIDSVEETLVPVSCMNEAGQCACTDQCLTHGVWQGLAERIREFLSSITLEDLTREARQETNKSQ